MFKLKPLKNSFVNKAIFLLIIILSLITIDTVVNKVNEKQFDKEDLPSREWLTFYILWIKFIIGILIISTLVALLLAGIAAFRTHRYYSTKGLSKV